MRKSFVFILLQLLVALPIMATEALRPLTFPQTSITTGALAELRDDIYSADVGWNIELAPHPLFSIYTDMSYRLISYQWDIMLHDQIHEMVNLQTNGLNESFAGIKVFPLKNFGIITNWRFKPGEGGRTERFERLGIEPTALYHFSKDMLLGLSPQYYTFLKSDHYKPGDEIGIKSSFIWNLWRSKRNRSEWRLDYVFLYRWRIEQSQNFSKAKDFQKMKDLYRGFRMRADIVRFFDITGHILGIGAAYEMNRGNLFGQETGHRTELYVKWEL